MSIVVLALVGMWVYVFSGAAGRDPPDQLDDPAIGVDFEPICAQAREAIDALPPAREATTAAERAPVITSANEVLEAMLTDLGEVALDGTDRDRRLVGLWLADWATFVDDRRSYATALTTDEAAELLVSDRAGRQITVTVDRFAEINDMASCATPLDA